MTIMQIKERLSEHSPCVVGPWLGLSHAFGMICCYFNVTIMLMNVIKMIKDKSRTLCEGTDRGCGNGSVIDRGFG